MAKIWTAAHPDSGATVTLSHGDLRGDNIFFQHDRRGFVMIDHQLMFLGPIPSDLAYLCTSGSTSPEVWARLPELMQEFYDLFITKSKVYTKETYPYEKYKAEFALCGDIFLVYCMAIGNKIWKGGEVGATGTSPELNTSGEGFKTETDLPPEMVRQRGWWKKIMHNWASTWKTLERLQFLEEFETQEPKSAKAHWALVREKLPEIRRQRITNFCRAATVLMFESTYA